MDKDLFDFSFVFFLSSSIFPCRSKFIFSFYICKQLKITAYTISSIAEHIQIVAHSYFYSIFFCRVLVFSNSSACDWIYHHHNNDRSPLNKKSDILSIFFVCILNTFSIWTANQYSFFIWYLYLYLYVLVYDILYLKLFHIVNCRNLLVWECCVCVYLFMTSSNKSMEKG